MLQFGMPALVEMEDLEETAALCRELGLSFIELNMNFPQYQFHTMDTGKLRAVARAYGIFYTLHLDDNMNVADFNPAVAGAYEAAVLDAVSLAAELEIPVINMHLSRGGVVTLPERKVYLFEQHMAQYLDRIRVFRDRCHRAANGRPVRICVENTTGYPDWQVKALDLLLESPVFGLTLDTGHDYCTGGTDLDVICQRSSRLHHMHLHDAALPKRDHLALGDGKLEICDRLALARRCGCTVVLEIKTAQALRRSVDWLKAQESLQ